MGEQEIGARNWQDRGSRPESGSARRQREYFERIEAQRDALAQAIEEHERVAIDRAGGKHQLVQYDRDLYARKREILERRKE